MPMPSLYAADAHNQFPISAGLPQRSTRKPERSSDRAPA
ncbi:hypothetical protein [Azospirillum endophyticum]